MTNIVLAAQAAGQGSGMSMIIMMVAIFAIMWFFMIKPQQKKQKEICRRHRREDIGIQRHVERTPAEISTDRYGESQSVANDQKFPVQQG